MVWMATHLLGECGVHGVGNVRRCCGRRRCLVLAGAGDEVFEMFPGWLALGWAGIASAANRGRVDGRDGFSWVLRFERAFHHCRAGQGWPDRETRRSRACCMCMCACVPCGLVVCSSGVTEQFALLILQ